MSGRALVEARGLTKVWHPRRGLLGRRTPGVRAVDGVDLDVNPGETVASWASPARGSARWGGC